MAIGKINLCISSKNINYDSKASNQNEPSFGQGFIIKYGIPQVSRFFTPNVQKTERMPQKTALQWLMEQIAKDKPKVDTDAGKFKYGIPEVVLPKTRTMDEVCIKYAIPQEPSLR